MSVLLFDQIKPDSKVGAKAKKLALLKKKKYPVLDGVLLTEDFFKRPQTTALDEALKILNTNNFIVRTSAQGEDGEQYSYAGQGQSFLNVPKDEVLKKANLSFNSFDSYASKHYEQYFKNSKVGSVQSSEPQVLIQPMADLKLSGVFFTKDPRGNHEGWLLEYIDGHPGEILQGSVTPKRLDSKTPFFEHHELFEELLVLCKKLKKDLGEELDIEWGVDLSDQLWILQVRPITAMTSKSNVIEMLDYEQSRLEKKYSQNILWDGKTFSEWMGFPSYFTFSIWKRAFSPKYAFGEAIKEIGYIGFSKKDKDDEHSVLERVYGRAYLNMERVGDLFFGRVPLKVVPKPHLELKFDFTKITPLALMKLPRALYRMIIVAWNLSSNRKKWLNSARKELVNKKSLFNRPRDSEELQEWTNDEVFDRLDLEVERFCAESLKTPMILIFLTESTMRSLKMLLKSLFGLKDAEKKLNEWLSYGLKTVNSRMNDSYRLACSDLTKRPLFLSRYGHRGPGELDLLNPRWYELGESAFVHFNVTSNKKKKPALHVEKEIQSLKTFKKSVILQEWRILKELLELREQWKMEILKPYARIRELVLEVGRRTELGEDMHWLRFSEINVLREKLEESSESLQKYVALLKSKVLIRKKRFHVFERYNFPHVLNLKTVKSIISGNYKEGRQGLDGEAISPGVTFGEVRVVSNPFNVDTSEWPENVILVAKSTDPGWTPLFSKVKGIVVENGGVLSHCAILAREMNIPAISQVHDCFKQLKDGDQISINGYTGMVNLERSE